MLTNVSQRYIGITATSIQNSCFSNSARIRGKVIEQGLHELLLLLLTSFEMDILISLDFQWIRFSYWLIFMVDQSTTTVLIKFIICLCSKTVPKLLSMTLWSIKKIIFLQR